MGNPVQSQSTYIMKIREKCFKNAFTAHNSLAIKIKRYAIKIKEYEYSCWNLFIRFKFFYCLLLKFNFGLKEFFGVAWGGDGDKYNQKNSNLEINLVFCAHSTVNKNLQNLENNFSNFIFLLFRVLSFSWHGDTFMVPDDPLGRDGPSLTQFLHH